MAVQPLSSTLAAASASNAAATSSSTAGNNTALTQNDFLNLLTTQMQYQDPMNPVSSTDFAAQLAQFASLQGVQQLNTSITQLLTLQQVTQGANLIGKQISFTSGANSTPGSGVVNSVQISNGVVQLMVGNQSIPVSQVTSIAAGS
jgi:flagellar basal-body rod modification protein FlgD